MSSALKFIVLLLSAILAANYLFVATISAAAQEPMGRAAELPTSMGNLEPPKASISSRNPNLTTKYSQEKALAGQRYTTPDPTPKRTNGAASAHGSMVSGVSILGITSGLVSSILLPMALRR